MKEDLTTAEKELQGLLQVLQTKLSPIKTTSEKGNNDLIIVLTSEGLGHGNEALGKILMKFFLKTLSTASIKPKLLVLMGDAIHLACEHSPSLNILSMLGEQGIKILIDGTSTDYFQVENKIKIGQVVSMISICTELMGPGRVISL